jgi:hypothetical protein
MNISKSKPWSLRKKSLAQGGIPLGDGLRVLFCETLEGFLLRHFINDLNTKITDFHLPWCPTGHESFTKASTFGD